MKNRYAFYYKGLFARTSLLFLFLLSSIMASAQQVEVTLTEAGTLSEKIASDQKYSITSLKVSGPINGTDVRYLREMAGRDYKGSTTDGKLVDLDLTDAKIKAGGDDYYNFASVGYYTRNDTIGDRMFRSAKLKCIKLPNSVVSIGERAFASCKSLTSVTIPNSVKSIGNLSFYGCSGLTSITIPNSMEYIGLEAFSDCSSLTSITIPNSVEYIGSAAFSGCSGLTSITIPNSVTVIGGRAFTGCSGLTSITIPNSVTGISLYTFSGCSGLTSITIPNLVASIGEGAFMGCSGLTSITIPNSVTSIGDYAFKNCSGVTSITIPNSVMTIGDHVFSGCTALVSLISYRTEPLTFWEDQEAVLDGINKTDCTLYVPAEAIDAYKAADQWKDFVHVESIDKYLAGVTQTEMNKNEKVLRRYDINGRQISKPSKGLNILMMSNGTTKKVLVK